MTTNSATDHTRTDGSPTPSKDLSPVPWEDALCHDDAAARTQHSAAPAIQRHRSRAALVDRLSAGHEAAIRLDRATRTRSAHAEKDAIEEAELHALHQAAVVTDRCVSLVSMDDFADYTGGGGVGGVPDSTGGSTKPHQSLGRNFGKNPVPPGGPTDITQLAPGQRPDESTPPDMAYRGLPVMFMRRAGGTIEPAPFLMTMEEVADLLRLRESGIRNPEATLRRYRKSGLQCVRVSRRVLFRLDDVLRWLDGQRAESVG